MEDAMPQGVPSAGARSGHESSEISPRGILIFIVCLVGTVALVLAMLGLAIGRFAHREKSVDVHYPGRLAIEAGQFPKPRLQEAPAADLAEIEAEERQRIETYGWVDRKAGIARIPVDRALEILAKKGLPKVAAPAPVPGAPPDTSIPPGTKRSEPRREGQANKPEEKRREGANQDEKP